MFSKKKPGNAKDFFNSLPPKWRAIALIGGALVFYLLYSLAPSFSSRHGGTADMDSSGGTLDSSLPEVAPTGNKVTWTLWNHGEREICFYESKTLTKCMSDHAFFAMRRSASGDTVQEDGLSARVREPNPSPFTTLLNSMTKPDKQ